MFRLYITLLLSCICLSYASAQYHTLNLPRPSPGVQETQTLGITKITIEYSSPAVRGRDVWNEVVPYDGQPIAWRAGANMNTRIQFSTDVTINGVSVPAGSYGLHMIPRKEKDWSLLLAENDQQWGSYYLDIEKDVFKSIEITPGECDHRENLTYEFLDRTDSTLVVALDWEKKSIPFTVGVDLNKTVIESLHSELLGVNTYRWEAWNDAARWCLNRNTNLEEALEWANRSINGGYNGFAADKNLNNLSTKIEILKALRRDEEARTTMAEALEPWDLKSLTAFNSDYLSGFRAETYTVGLRDGFTFANGKMTPVIQQTIRRDIGGDEQRIHDMSPHYTDITYKHILLPIWMSSYQYKGKAYRFLVNGRTGEVQGDRPYSWVKIASAVAGALLFIGGAVYGAYLAGWLN